MFKSLVKNVILLFDRLSLVKKLILSYILILLIPIVIFGVYYYITFKTDTEVGALRECQHAVQQAGININQNIEMCVRAALTVTGNKELLEFVSTNKNYSTEELIAFKNGPLVNVENFQNANTNIYQLRFFVSDNSFPEIWPVIYSENRILESDWRSKVLDLKGGYFWRLNHPGESMQADMTDIGDVVSLYCEVKNHSNEYAGILEVNMLAKDFFADMYSPLQDENSFMCVRDKNNRMMWNTESRFLNNTSLDTQWIQGNLAEGTKGLDGNFTLEHQGQTLMVSYEYIKLIDCYVYQITSISGLIKKIGRTRNIIILGSLASIIILSVVTYFMTSIILVKMKTIIASMRKVQDGELNV